MNYINQIIHGDCKYILPQLPENSIDLVITSPPYDEIRTYQNQCNKFDFDVIAPFIYRVLQPGGVLVWVVADQTIKGSESGTSMKQALKFMDIGFRLYDTMIYEKSWAPYPALVRYNQIWEYMFVFSKGKPKTINLIKDKPNKYAGAIIDRRNPSFRCSDGTMKSSSKSKDGKPKYVADFSVRGNIWRYKVGGMVASKDRIAFKHPAIFPEDLARDHILTWSNPGDIVLDLMCGSGTVPKQAKLLGRNYIGIEVVKDYCDIALERLKKSVDLFSI